MLVVVVLTITAVGAGAALPVSSLLQLGKTLCKQAAAALSSGLRQPKASAGGPHMAFFHQFIERGLDGRPCRMQKSFQICRRIDIA